MIISTPTPELVVRKARIGFEERRLPWLKTVNGMRLVQRVQTLSVDEDSGLEQLYTEVKFVVRNAHTGKMFEVTVRCDSPQLNEEFYIFSLKAR